jgi:hypothetical protein
LTAIPERCGYLLTGLCRPVPQIETPEKYFMKFAYMCERFSEHSCRRLYTAWERDPHNVAVTVEACKALASLSYDADACTIIVKTGGLSRACSALTRHESNGDVAEAACVLLWNASRSSYGRHALGVVHAEAVLQRMLAVHASDAYVVKYATMALTNLAVGRV